MTTGINKTVIVLAPGSTGPTGAYKTVNISATGPTGSGATGLFATWSRATGATSAFGPTGTYETVIDAGPTGATGAKSVVIPGYPVIFSGAAIDMNFKAGLYYGRQPSGLTTSRASQAYANDALGNWTSFAANVARITNNGLLVEEARTNSIGNNSMQGAVVGSPGTAPTRWSTASSNGITYNIVGMGTLSGIDYIDIQMVGTPTTAYNDLQVESNSIALTTGQTWTQSMFVALIAGSLANITAVNLVTYALPNANDNLVLTFTPTAVFTRYSLAYTFSVATNTSLNPRLAFNVTSGGAINATFRIGWPQLELGSTVTSPIRTTAAAATRAADVITLTTPPTFGASYSMYGQGTPQVPISYNTQVMVSIDDGTGSLSNAIELTRGGGSGVANMTFKTGGTLFSANSVLAMAQNVSAKAAISATAGAQSLTLRGAAVVTTAGTPMPVGVNEVLVGSYPTGATFYNGFLERLALWPTTKITDAQLQAITT